MRQETKAGLALLLDYINVIDSFNANRYYIRVGIFRRFATKYRQLFSIAALIIELIFNFLQSFFMSILSLN